jgi:glucokinase
MIKQNKTYAIGIDIGGTKMSAVLFDGQKAVADYVLATPKDSLEHFMIMLKALVEPLFARAAKDGAVVKGLGVGVPATLDYQESKIITAPNLPLLNGLKLTASLAERLGVQDIKIDNDAHCFLRAEALLGAGRKAKNIFGLTIGTGLGGAWWFDKQIYYGSHGAASEPGWTVIDYKEGIRLEEAYHKLAQHNPASLAEKAYRGDILAEKSYREFGHYLGIALANIVNMIDPQLIIIGGGAVQSGDLFLTAAKKSLRQYIHSPVAKKIKIVRGKLGAGAGAVGAALLVA